MRIRLRIIALLCALTVPMTVSVIPTTVVAAEERQITAEEITTLLTGNTVSGTWGNTQYRQYYGEGGFTMYVPEGGRASQGKWRVDAETGHYESWWENSGWSSYEIRKDGGVYFWVSGNRQEAFVVLPGKQVSW